MTQKWWIVILVVKDYYVLHEGNFVVEAHSPEEAIYNARKLADDWTLDEVQEEGCEYQHTYSGGIFGPFDTMPEEA